MLTRDERRAVKRYAAAFKHFDRYRAEAEKAKALSQAASLDLSEARDALKALLPLDVPERIIALSDSTVVALRRSDGYVLVSYYPSTVSLERA